ncbi:kinase-like domain-containing protein, partial [Mycena maculata]
MFDDPNAVEEDLQRTQEDQVQTQPLTQEGDAEPTDKFFGYLNPCSQALARVELFKDQPEVCIGRSPTNKVVFPGFKISNFHAIIRWNGIYGPTSVVTIEDNSSNGTFINGEKIGKGQNRILRDGCEVAFGVPVASKEHGGIYDYRFIFRDFVSTVIRREIYKYYDLSVELGKGSFATVYKALHMATSDWVAVKVIHETKRQPTPTSGSNPGNTREIKIMEHLAHPNICRQADRFLSFTLTNSACRLREVFWNTNGSIDLVLELVEGGDLLDFILDHNGLSEGMAKHITYQLCQALSYIHGKGITHRDLKPENVLLTDNNPPIVKVADFGLAKIVDSMTMLKTMCGTPSYLAPEVVTQQNNSGYDSLVDSWSVGVILFSMLTNTNPFIETSVEDLKTRIASRHIDWTQLEMLKYQDSQGGYYGLSDEVQDFIHRLLDFDPRQRMKLGDALGHVWFKNFVFVYPEIDYPRIASGSGTLSEDAEGRLTPPSSTPPGLTLHKKGALQRRSEVLQQAAEAGRAPVEPSWEMVTYAQSQEQAQPQPQAQEEEEMTPSQEELYGPVSDAPPTPKAAATNGKGARKRVHAELTPLPEEGTE